MARSSHSLNLEYQNCFILLFFLGMGSFERNILVTTLGILNCADLEHPPQVTWLLSGRPAGLLLPSYWLISRAWGPCLAWNKLGAAERAERVERTLGMTDKRIPSLNPSVTITFDLTTSPQPQIRRAAARVVWLWCLPPHDIDLSPLLKNFEDEKRM